MWKETLLVSVSKTLPVGGYQLRPRGFDRRSSHTLLREERGRQLVVMPWADIP